MNRLRLISLVLFSLVFLVDAQTISNNHKDANSSDTVPKSRPSLAIVIGILCGMFALTLSLVVACIGFDSHGATVHGGVDQLPTTTTLNRTKSGFDKRVIESLPFFRFSSIKGSKQGLDCSVCLTKFEDTEVVRLLPQCKHAFHVTCIDEWLEKHSSCPLCRLKINADDTTIFTYSNSSRFLRNGSNLNIEPNVDHHNRSSNFSIGTSSHKIFDTAENDDVLKNGRSNLSSSDIMVLNSEMINDMSSDIFREFKETNKAIENEKTVKINEEFEIKIDTISGPVDPSTSKYQRT